MKRTGTTSWFHRDIPKARRPYTSTTWAREKNTVRYWWFVNKRIVKSIATKKLTLIHMALAMPKENRRYIKLQSEKQWAQFQQWHITTVWRQVPDGTATTRATQCPSLRMSCLELLAAACSQQERWGHVQPSQTFLPSLNHSNAVFSIATAKSLHTLGTERWTTSLQSSASALLHCLRKHSVSQTCLSISKKAYDCS